MPYALADNLYSRPKTASSEILSAQEHAYAKWFLRKNPYQERCYVLIECTEGRTIHSNGRVYDPIIARFLSADPFIQAPKMSESYNRYSYVMNNPLYFTDPSGYLWKDIRKAVIAVAAFAIGCPQCAQLAWAGSFSAIAGAKGFAVGVAAATTAHTYRSAKDMGASTSSAMKMGVKAGATALATAPISSAIGAGVPFEGLMVPVNLMAHGLVGAVAAGLNGGNPSDGFKSSIIGVGLGKALGVPKTWNPTARTIAAGATAALIAKITGGNAFFSASIAMMQHAHNWEQSARRNQAECKGNCHGIEGLGERAQSTPEQDQALVNGALSAVGAGFAAAGCKATGLTCFVSGVLATDSVRQVNKAMTGNDIVKTTAIKSGLSQSQAESIAITTDVVTGVISTNAVYKGILNTSVHSLSAGAAGVLTFDIFSTVNTVNQMNQSLETQ